MLLASDEQKQKIKLARGTVKGNVRRRAPTHMSMAVRKSMAVDRFSMAPITHQPQGRASTMAPGTKIDLSSAVESAAEKAAAKLKVKASVNKDGTSPTKTLPSNPFTVRAHAAKKQNNHFVISKEQMKVPTLSNEAQLELMMKVC